MKIYCIKIDSVPFSRDVHKINNVVGGHLVRQIGGCYTTETLLQMLTGKNSSQLFPHGFGYHRWEDYCKNLNDRDQVTGKRFKNAIPEYDWVKESLPYILHDQGFRFEVMNEVNVGVPLSFMRYDWYNETLIKTSEVEKHRDFVQRMQESNDNIFCMTNCTMMHDACDLSSSLEDLQVRQKNCIPNILELLGHWDFSELNALFWVYSDHGHYRFPSFGGYPYAHNFVSWVSLRDNTRRPSTLRSRIISATDFYEYVLRNHWPKHEVFYTEDGRLNIEPKKSTTAIACELAGDNFHYVSYHKPDDKFDHHEYVMRRDLNLFPIEEFDSNAEGLIRSLEQHFDWVK